MKLWPKKVFGTASAEAAHETLHTALPNNEPLELSAGRWLALHLIQGPVWFSVLESTRKLW